MKKELWLLMSSDAIFFLKRCLQIYSPSGNEKEYSSFIANFLKERGFQTKFDEIGNLIAEKGLGKPKLLLVSHFDTIPGELPIIEKNGKIFGRGAVDCKPSLAAMVYSISEYDFTNINTGKLIFVGIVREEESLRGIEEFLKSDIEADYALFGEPTKIDQICISYKGRLCLNYKVTTETGHVASAWLFNNSIIICNEIWNVVKSICWELNQKYQINESSLPFFNKIIPNLTQITGGELSNTVPENCSMTIDIRFPPQIKIKEILNKIRKKIDDIKNIYENNTTKTIKIQENILSVVKGYDFEGDKMIIGALRWAIFNSINRKPKLIKKTGTTMINLIAVEKNIPSITYGPGDPKLEHTKEEFIDINEYLMSIQILLKFYDKFFINFQKIRN